MNDQKLYKWIFLATITFIVHGSLMYVYLHQQETDEVNTEKNKPQSLETEVKMLFIQPEGKNTNTPLIFMKKTKKEDDTQKSSVDKEKPKKRSANRESKDQVKPTIDIKKQEKLSNTLLDNNKNQPDHVKANIQEKRNKKSEDSVTNTDMNNHTIEHNNIEREIVTVPMLTETEQDIKDKALLSIDLPRSQQKNNENKDDIEVLDKHDQIKKEAEDLNEELSRSIESIKKINQRRMEKEKQFSERAYQKQQGIVVGNESDEQKKSHTQDAEPEKLKPSSESQAMDSAQVHSS